MPPFKVLIPFSCQFTYSVVKTEILFLYVSVTLILLKYKNIMARKVLILDMF